MRYGLSYRDVEELLAERGIEVDHVTVHRWVRRFTPPAADGVDCRRFWLAESHTAVTVAASGRDGPLAAGDVWSIEAPWRAEQVAARQPGQQRQAVKDGLTHLLRLDDTERAAWLDRRQPRPDDANWWLYLLLVVDGQIGNRPGEHADWVALKLWLLRQAYARGAFTPVDSALRIAYFVAGMRAAAPDLAATLPSADEVVGACLAAIPVGLDQIAVLDDRRDLHRLTHTQMLHSRQARNLVSAAGQHLGHIRDQGLAERLRQWLAVKPRLV